MDFIFLKHTGLFDIHISDMEIPFEQETKKYRKIVLHSVSICGCQFQNTEFLISRFEKSWGIDALIGLDLFRTSRITIDYNKSLVVSEPF